MGISQKHLKNFQGIYGKGCITSTPDPLCPLESNAQGLGHWRGNMNPTKFPPKNQSLLALGMSLACGRPLGGGVEGRLGVNWEDGFVVFY